MFFSSLVFSQTPPCDAIKEAHFNAYIDDKISALEDYLKNSTWLDCSQYSDYDECRLYGLLDDLKSYSNGTKTYYCSKVLSFCEGTLEKEKLVLVVKEIFILGCDKPYVTFDFNYSDCNIFE
jgi:hypothetical protein